MNSKKFALPEISEVPHSCALLCCRCPPSIQYGLKVLGVFARVPSLKNSGRGFKEGEIEPLPESSFSRARLGGLEPPRSHESSLTPWTSPAGYRSENSWLTMCVIPATLTQYSLGYA